LQPKQHHTHTTNKTEKKNEKKEKEREKKRNRTRENDLVLQSPFSSDPTVLVSLFKFWVPDLKRACKNNKV
jgi:hypothetical protein